MQYQSVHQCQGITLMEQGEASQAQSARPLAAGAKRAPVIVGISGSSGAILACRAVAVLAELGLPLHITYTAAARQVWPDEVGRPLQDDLAEWRQRYGARVFNPDDFRAPMSSGSFLTVGMIVIP